jgi:hypothetical protein
LISGGDNPGHIRSFNQMLAESPGCARREERIRSARGVGQRYFAQLCSTWNIPLGSQRGGYLRCAS